MADVITKGQVFKGRLFILKKLDEAGAGGNLETSYAKTDTPVKILDTVKFPSTLLAGKILRIHYRLNPTNAVTYTLRLYASALAADYASNNTLLYESAALRADDTDYDVCEIVIPFRLDALAVMYFALEWTGAPGVTAGFIRVEGEVIE